MIEATKVDGKKLYKVLSPEGESQNGGTLKWSLPKNGKAGKWHEVEEVRMCSFGLHLTTEPANWWKPNCRVFEVEAEDFLLGAKGKPSFDDDKCVARRVRLLRELTQEELVGVGIIRFGEHTISTGRVIVEGSSQVTAYGSSQVKAYDSSRVTAYGSSQVKAYDSSRVTASGSSRVTASGSSQVKAYDSSQVTASGSSQVTASGSSQVTAYGSSQVTAYGSSQVTASGSSQVTAYGSSQVTAYGSSQVTAYDSSQVTASGSSRVTASGSSRVTASGQCDVSIPYSKWEYNQNVSVDLADEACVVDRRKAGKPEFKAGA